MPDNTIPLAPGAPALNPVDITVSNVGERRRARQSLENVFAVTAICGDLVSIVAGFVFAYWLRLVSGWIPFFHINPPSPVGYWKLILLGWFIVFVGMLRENLYRYEFVYNPRRMLDKLFGVLGVSMFIFLALSLAAKTDPPISRVFVICAAVLVFILFYAWRLALSQIIRLPRFSQQLRRRLLIVGWSEQAVRVRNTSLPSDDTVWNYIGWIKGSNASGNARADECLGTLEELPALLRAQDVDVVLIADPRMASADITIVAKICEREHADFRMIPRFFEVLVSGLHASTIGNVPVLGVEALPLQSHFNRVIKRMVDIAGSIVGIILSLPVITVCGFLIWLESRGNIFFLQERIGHGGIRFSMIKLRSMKLGAEKSDNLSQSTLRQDDRMLRIGKFMRKWNLDETPQFLNVFLGDMSLVGPRPERTYHSEKLSEEIPHYNLRYSCKPGMTGWAQISGWRGNTDLQQRIEHDIWYVEHWNLWLDFKIMILTFVKLDNAY